MEPLALRQLAAVYRCISELTPSRFSNVPPVWLTEELFSGWTILPLRWPSGWGPPHCPRVAGTVVTTAISCCCTVIPQGGSTFQAFSVTAPDWWKQLVREWVWECMYVCECVCARAPKVIWREWRGNCQSHSGIYLVDVNLENFISLICADLIAY